MSNLKTKKSDTSKYSGIVKKLRGYGRDEVINILKRYSKKEMLAILEEYNKSSEQLKRKERNAKQTVRRATTKLLYDYQNKAKIRLVGCSPYEFWEMNGSPSEEELRNLHIDHIVPLSWFDLSNEDHLKVSNHYLNLQYLNSKGNKTKGDRYAGRPDNILGYKGEFDVDGYVAEILEKIKDLNLDSLK